MIREWTRGLTGSELRPAAGAVALRPAELPRAVKEDNRTQSDADDPELRHALRPIADSGYRVLRVVFNQTQDPPHVVTVFFDRTMKDKP